jgi:ParB family chromosome partitioning protein
MRHDRHFVDELTQRSGEGIGRMIAVTSISSNTDQPRSNLGDLDDLISSIAKHGVLEPLLVRKIGRGYELVSGERRFHAAIRAGLSEVPCVELTVTDGHALEIALIENLQRKDLNAFEEGEGYRTLIDKYGYTHEEVAAAVGRSRVTVTETLKILTIPDEIREICRHADINAKGILLEVAKAPSIAAMHTLLEAIFDEGLDRAQVRDRRKELAGGEGTGRSDGDQKERPPRPRPFVVRYRAADRPYSLSLSFKTEAEPEPREVIAALEDILRQLREELDQTEK